MLSGKLTRKRFQGSHVNDGHPSTNTHVTGLFTGHDSFSAWLRRKSFSIPVAKACAIGMLTGLSLAASATPFPEGNPFIFVSVGVQTPANPTKMQLYTAEQLIPGGDFTFKAEGGPTAPLYNAIGFHTEDRYLYGMQRGNRNLLRIGLGGVVTTVGAVTFTSGFPADNQIDNYGDLTIGDFGDDTCAYVHPSGAKCEDVLFVKLGTGSAPYTSRIWAIDIIHLNAATIPLSLDVPNVSDFVFSQGYLWAVMGGVTAPNPVTIYRINPSTGAVNKWNLPTVNGTGAAAISTAGIIRQSYGAQWKYGNGDLGISGNTTGVAYHIKLTNPDSATPGFQIVSALPAPTSTQNDGAAYIGHSIDLSIEKVASPSTYSPGKPLSYTLTVTNDSPWYSSGAIITDTLPAELQNPTTTSPGCSIAASGGNNVLTCVMGALAGNGKVSVTVTGTVAANAHACFSNTAFVAGNEKDEGDPDNDKSDITVCTPQVSITKTANPPGALKPGDEITYTVTVTNTGTLPAPNTVVSDAFPAGIASATWTCTATPGTICPHGSGTSAAPNLLKETIATFPEGGVVTYTIAAKAVTNDLPPSVMNTATASPQGGACANGDPLPCSATAVNASVPVVGITKTTDVTKVVPGGTIVYKITADNLGSMDAVNVVVSDPKPAGIDSMTWTCEGAACPHASGTGNLKETLAKLAAGDHVIYTVTAKASSAPPGLITNTATVEVPGGVCARNACAASVNIDPPPPAGLPSAAIPTLSWWSLLALTALLAGVAARMRRY